MKDLLPFTKEPKCPKCLNESAELGFRFVEADKNEPEYIEVMCEICGFSWDMETADNKPKEIMEKAEESGRVATGKGKKIL